MKRLALFFSLILSLHAAGNIQQNFQQLGTSNNFVLSANWTGDPITGVISPVPAQFTQAVQGFRIFAVEVAPGSPAPTNNYTITLTTPAGVDMLAGVGVSLSNTTPSSLQTPSFAPPVNGTVTINITGNSVGGAKGSLLIYFAPISQISGLIPNGPGFPTNNTFTGTNAFTGPVTTGNFNNIRIVDGFKFAQSAAGINAADADLGSSVGEVWVPPGSIIASDAQISIRTTHVLKVFGQLTINAQTQGPILLASGSRLTCVGGPTKTATIFNAGTAITSMVRATVQDGSQSPGIFIDGCTFNANGATVTNGVIDMTGSTGQGWVRDTWANNYSSGWGIFVQDNQTGALAGTNNVQIVNNRLTPNGTGGCIEILHSATNAVQLGGGFDIVDTNCTGGSSLATAPILIQNTSTGNRVRGLTITNLIETGQPNTQPGITLNGVEQAILTHISCFAGNNCINVVNTLQNDGLVINDVFAYAGNTLQDSVNSVTIGPVFLAHYESPNNTTTFSYLPTVSYLKVQGLAPASATGTGFGTGPLFAFGPGSTNNAGTVIVTAGTTPSASGTLTVTFNTTQTNFGPDQPACVVSLGGNSGSFNARATVFISNAQNTSLQVAWDNNAVNLTGSSSYNFFYWCAAK